MNCPVFRSKPFCGLESSCTLYHLHSSSLLIAVVQTNFDIWTKVNGLILCMLSNLILLHLMIFAATRLIAPKISIKNVICATPRVNTAIKCPVLLSAKLDISRWFWSSTKNDNFIGMLRQILYDCPTVVNAIKWNTVG